MPKLAHRFCRMMLRATRLKPMLKAQVGERLWWLLDFGPKAELLRLTKSWISSASDTLDDNAVVRVAAGLLTSFPELGSTPAAQKLLRAARRVPDVHVLGVIARAAAANGMPPPKWVLSAIAKWANKKGWRDSKKQRTIGRGRDVAEARCLVSLIKHSTQGRRNSLERILHLAESTWSVLPELAPVFHPDFWENEWPSLLKVRRPGGHSRLPKSWLLQRIRLVTELLRSDECIRAHFMQSTELAFLRFAVVEGIAHGDSTLANHAVYLLPLLTRNSVDSAESGANASALAAAADDIRIGVAHGAAFGTAYIIEASRREPFPDEVVHVASSTNTKLARDALAVVRRQVAVWKNEGDSSSTRGRKHWARMTLPRRRSA